MKKKQIAKNREYFLIEKANGDVVFDMKELKK